MVETTYTGNDNKLRLYSKAVSYSKSLPVIVSVFFIICSTVFTASICTASIRENKPQQGQIVHQEQDVIVPPPGQTILFTEAREREGRNEGERGMGREGDRETGREGDRGTVGGRNIPPPTPTPRPTAVPTVPPRPTPMHTVIPEYTSHPPKYTEYPQPSPAHTLPPRPTPTHVIDPTVPPRPTLTQKPTPKPTPVRTDHPKPTPHGELPK